MDTELCTQIRKSVDKIVAENMKNNLFSACSVGIIEGEDEAIETTVFHYGDSGQVTGAKQVDSRTIYDLASLTKPLVTSLSLLALVEEKQIKLSDPVTDYFAMSDKKNKNIQILHLLEHTSGLPPHREFFKELITLPEEKREEVLIERITGENLVFIPGTGELYSDLGYILLGKIIEKVSGEKLDSYWQKTILSPLGLEKGLFFKKNEIEAGGIYPATGFCQWSKRELCGLVNDDNCRSVGGVAGHAGLFATAEGLVKFCECILKMYSGIYSHPALSFDLIRKKLDNKHGRWVLGFDTPTGQISSSGKYFSDKTLGHLGFTGTSFWLDCKNKRGIIVLTNRVLCSQDLTPIRKLRPRLHDAIMEKLIPVNKPGLV